MDSLFSPSPDMLQAICHALTLQQAQERRVELRNQEHQQAIESWRRNIRIVPLAQREACEVCVNCEEQSA